MWKEEVLSSPKIKKVKFHTAFDLFELEQKVNEALKDGWEVYGNLIERSVGYSMMMVKYGDNVKRPKR